MAQLFNIDASDVVQLTNKLERMHKSSLPISARGALNDAAFDAKKRTIPEEFDEEFTVRKRNFITSHTRAIKSKNTFDIKKMEATAGVIKGKSKSGDQLKFQEKGGTIQDRGFIPTEFARIAEQPTKLVKRQLYYNKFVNNPKGQVDRNSKRTLIKTDKALLRVKKGGIWDVVYRLRGSVDIPKSPFIAPAAERTAKRIGEFFKKQAQRRVK